MSVLSGYGKYKRYVLTDTGYKLCSQWTSSNTVHFDDGKTAQTKLGAISGITDSLTATSSNVALSAKAGKNLQDQVTELNTGLPYIGNFKNQKKLTDSAYTAEFDCMAYVYVVTNTTQFGSIIISVNGIYVRQYQNPTSQQGLSDGTLVALKKGDTIAVSGSGLKNYSITVQY